MDILHIDMWPTSGLTKKKKKKCIWSGSAIWWGMLGKFLQVNAYLRAHYSQKTCIWPRTEKERDLSALPHRQGNHGLFLNPPGQRTKLSLKDNTFFRYNHRTI